MGLSIRVTGADEYGQYLKCLICGDPGAGKTRSSSTWPNPLIASVNANLMSVADRQVPYAAITSSADLLQLRHMLDNPPERRAELIGRPVDTLIVDTIDHFQQILAAERRRDEKKDTLAGADWGWLGDEMRSIVRGLRNLPLHVVLLCHLKVTEDQETNRVMVRPSLQGAMGDEIAGYVDVALAFKAVTTLEVSPDGQSSQRVVHRYAQTYPDPQLAWVRDNSGNLPPEFEVNFTDDFERLYGAVFGGLDLPASTVLAYLDDAVKATALAPSGNSHVQVAAKPVAAKPVPQPNVPVPPPPPPPPPTIVEPEPLPESEPLAQPTPEQIAPEAVAEAEAAADLAAALTSDAPATNGAAADTRPPCDNCGGRIESDDQLDLSNLRYRKPLCRICYIDAKRTPAPAR
jgi:hypothetical protein